MLGQVTALLQIRLRAIQMLVAQTYSAGQLACQHIWLEPDFYQSHVRILQVARYPMELDLWHSLIGVLQVFTPGWHASQKFDNCHNLQL